ncbi:hypothetical protein MOUN0_A02982 [Monosporozyma unispora]
MDKNDKDLGIRYTHATPSQRKETEKMVKDLREMFYTVDEKIVQTVVLASDGNKILAYNALLFYTEDKETYLNERLPVGVIVDISEFDTTIIKDKIEGLGTPSPDKVKSESVQNSVKSSTLQAPSPKKLTLKQASSPLKPKSKQVLFSQREYSSKPVSTLSEPTSQLDCNKDKIIPASEKKVTLSTNKFEGVESKPIEENASEVKEEKGKQLLKESSKDEEKDHNSISALVNDVQEMILEEKKATSDWNEVRGMEEAMAWADQEFDEDNGGSTTRNKRKKSPGKNSLNKPKTISQENKNKVVMSPGAGGMVLDSLLSQSSGSSPFKH